MSMNPNGGMNPNDLRDLCQLYALGVLDDEEAAGMERLLSEGGEDVQRAIREAVIVNATIASLAPQINPPARLKKKLLSMIGANAPQAGWNWMWAAVAAALVVALSWTGIDSARKTTELAGVTKAANDSRAALTSALGKTRADLARVNAALRFLDEPQSKLVGFGTGEPAPPRGNLFVNPRSGVLLVASNLPQLVDGKTYQMWMIPRGGKPVAAGVFQSDAAGTAVHLMAGAVDVRATGAIAVTVEPDGGSAQPTTTPIIVAPLAGL